RLFAGRPDRRALAELMLERQGIVTRDGVRAEGLAGGYGAVYGELRALETLGLCRRGDFVEGLGGGGVALGGRGGRGGGRAAGGGGAGAERGGGGRATRPRGGRPGSTVRRSPAVAATRGGQSRQGRWCVRRDARRRGGALRRAQRALARAVARPRRILAAPGAGRARRPRPADRRETDRRRAGRRPTGRR